MELLKGTAPTVEFVHPTSDTTGVSAAYSLDGGASVNVNVTTTDGVSTCRLPYLSNNSSVRVTWRFNIPSSGPFSQEYDYDVVTPYLSMHEVKKIVEGASDEEAAAVEAAVRHIINAHTGQSFGYMPNKVIKVEGNGETSLRLPLRLIRVAGVNTLTSHLDTRSFIIVSDGWYIKKGWADSTPKVDGTDSQFWGDFTDSVFDNNIYSDPDGDGREPIVGPLSSRPGGITVVPGSSGRATSWRTNYPFEIKGDWGYEKVPAPVVEAAKLLVNDYACMEILYRDRYLDSIKAADWNLSFNSRAWDSTGNVRADQLLSDYVMTDWAVI